MYPTLRRSFLYSSENIVGKLSASELEMYANGDIITSTTGLAPAQVDQDLYNATFSSSVGTLISDCFLGLSNLTVAVRVL